MERIGIAASRMAQGNLLIYNLCVIAISCLCSLLLFFVCAFTLLIALLLILFILRFLLPSELNAAWPAIIKNSLIALSAVVGALNIFAIVKNMKLTKPKI
jgi:hypothetical protein